KIESGSVAALAPSDESKRQPQWEQQRRRAAQLAPSREAVMCALLGVVNHDELRLLARRALLEARQDIEAPAQRRASFAHASARIPNSLALPQLGRHEHQIAAQHGVAEQLDVRRKLDAEMEHDAKPKRERARAAEPWAERQKKLAGYRPERR